VGIKILLDMESITSRDNWQNSKEEEIIPALNKGKRDYLNKEDLKLSKDL